MSCPYLHRCTASIHVIHFNAVEFCTFAFIFGDTSYEIQLLRRYYLKISFCIFTRCIWDNNINFRCYCLLEHHLLQFLSFRIQVELINVILCCDTDYLTSRMGEKCLRVAVDDMVYCTLYHQGMIRKKGVNYRVQYNSNSVWLYTRCSA